MTVACLLSCVISDEFLIISRWVIIQYCWICSLLFKVVDILSTFISDYAHWIAPACLNQCIFSPWNIAACVYKHEWIWCRVVCCTGPRIGQHLGPSVVQVYLTLLLWSYNQAVMFGVQQFKVVYCSQMTSLLSKDMKNHWKTSSFRAYGTAVWESAARIIHKQIWDKNLNGCIFAYILYSYKSTPHNTLGCKVGSGLSRAVRAGWYGLTLISQYI